MRRSCTAAAIAVVLLVLTACHGSGPAIQSSAQDAQPADTPSPSTTQTSAGVLIAVVRKSGSLAFFRVGRDRRARPVAEFAAPRSGDSVGSVSLASGQQPLACATWFPVAKDGSRDDSIRPSLVCYRPGVSRQPTTLAGVTGSPTTVALSADGQHIAWIDSLPQYETNVVVGALAGGGVTALERIRRGGTAQECSPCLDGVNAIAWAGDRALVLAREGQDDEGAGFGRIPLDDVHIKQGWQYGPTTMPAWKTDPSYKYFDYVQSADAQTAIAIERPSYNGYVPDSIRARAVTIDLTTGRRRSVIATALPGREVSAVSGRADAIVYRTAPGFYSSSQLRFYLRLSGDAAGLPITNLPRDTMSVTAQL